MPAPFRNLRLRKHADYRLVYGASRKHSSASFGFFYRDRVFPSVALPAVPPRSQSTESRFGITAPRAIGPAVLRHRIKRRVRIAARQALPVLPPGPDVVLHPRPEVATMPFPILLSEVEAVFATVARRLAAGAVNTPLPRVPRRNGKSRATARPPTLAKTPASPPR